MFYFLHQGDYIVDPEVLQLEAMTVEPHEGCKELPCRDPGIGTGLEEGHDLI